MDFMKLSKEYSGDKSEFLVLPIEYEGDVTYGKGAARGAEEIIKASEHLEYYDEQFDCEPFEKGIHTLQKLELKDDKPEKAMENISETVGKKKYKDKFLISLGGDHAVTIGIIKGVEKNHENFSVITLDAHPDFFHSWNNSQYNHRCTAQRVVENHKMLEVGIRSMDIDEKELIEKNDNINIIKSYDYSKDKLRKELKKLEDKVYISIDVDVFDPSFIRNTGTPEPGGFLWDKVIDILKIIFESKKVIGADIVEFAPESDSKYSYRAEAFALAKLCYKIIALGYKNNMLLR